MTHSSFQVCAQLLCHVWLFETPWTVALQAPLSMGFPKQEYWSGLPLPFPGDLPNPGIKPVSLAFASRLSLSHQGSPAFKIILCKSKQHLVFFTSLSFFPPAHSLTWKLIPHFWKLVKFFFFSKCWLNWVFIVACRLSLLVAHWLLFLQNMGSRLQRLCSCNAGVSLGMAHRFSSCPKACGILVLRLGTKPMSLALKSRLSTTGPPGKSHFFLLSHFWPLLWFTEMSYKHVL